MARGVLRKMGFQGVKSFHAFSILEKQRVSGRFENKNLGFALQEFKITNVGNYRVLSKFCAGPLWGFRDTGVTHGRDFLSLGRNH